jgi:hypothetical protein
MVYKKKRTFTKKNYNSKDGMLTSIWGPSFWHVLHTISFNYPVEPNHKQKKHYKNFMLELQNILPCIHCRNNYKEDLKKYPLNEEVMKNRENFSKHIYQLHERVNTLLQKNSGLSYNEVKDRYEHFRASCSKKSIKKTRKKKHKGCIIPLHKFKSKGVIKIIPDDTKCNSIEIDKKCNIIQ